MEINDHFFRREAGHLVSALTRIFGVHNLALAEDVVQDSFCRALETCPMRGVPDNPSAWLMATARNRALDVPAEHPSQAAIVVSKGSVIEFNSLGKVRDGIFELPGRIPGKAAVEISIREPGR